MQWRDLVGLKVVNTHEDRPAEAGVLISFESGIEVVVFRGILRDNGTDDEATVIGQERYGGGREWKGTDGVTA